MDFSFALTPLQQGMLLQSIGGEPRDCYVIQTVFAWEESISLNEFERAWKMLASRHEALRSSFRWKDVAEPQQVVAPEETVDFQVAAIRGNSAESRQTEIDAFLDADLKRGFPHLDAPPWRVNVLQDCLGNITAVWTFHHLLMDGRSHILLLRELLAIYDGLLAGTTIETAAEVPQHEHNRWMEQQDFSEGKQYWSQYLHEVATTAEFPQPFGGGRSSGKYAFCTGHFGPELTLALRRFSAHTGISAGNMVQLSWGLVLGWLSNRTDVVLGTVRACRKSGIPTADRLIGLMINTVPLRVRWNHDTAIETLLQGVAKDWRDFRKYEQTPLRQIRQWTSLPSSAELFSTALSYSSPHYLDAVFSDEATRRRRRIWLRQTTPYCSADVSASPGDVEVSLNMPGTLVEPGIASQLPAFLRNTLFALVGNPNQKVRDLCPLDPAARKRLVFSTNSRWEAKAAAIDWIERIAGFAASQPAKIAVENSEEKISWQSLASRSDEVAASLRRRGLKPGGLIALLLPRSPEFVWTCLGILKAGGAYLPLDPQWPPQRVHTVLADAKPFGTLTNDALAALLPADCAPFWINDCNAPGGPAEANSVCEIKEDSLAYVIYTSGSSGVPKGVEITHGGLQNLIDDAIATFSLTPGDRGCFLSNTAFDASVHEIWPLLAAGASLHLPDAGNLLNPVALLNWMDEQKISFAFVSVIMAEAVTQLAKGRPLSLRYLLTGGDQLRVVPDGALPFQLVNEYGPTEYSVVATRHPLAQSGRSATIPIGKPIRGTRAYVLNASFQLLPHGVPGELVLAGNGQARGYRNQPELTAEKFVANRLAEEPSPSLYRTGDLVRWMEDGNLQFLGRLDSQVKLRGFRIELGEIEASLLKHPSVAEAVVIFKEDPAPRLVAFIVAENVAESEVPESSGLEGHLRALVPEYMVPSQFVFQPSLPTNTSGKYDRKRLEALTLQPTSRRTGKPAAFRSPVEQQVATLFEDILNLPAVQPEDRFLSLGGTSLSIIQLLCALDRDFSAAIPVAEIFRNPTPADLAELIESKGNIEQHPLVKLRGGRLQNPLFCIPGAGGGIHWFRDLVEAMPAGRTVFGLELLSLSPQTKADFSVETAAAEIASLVAAATGPGAFCLCGYSGGGLLALAAAQRLQADGKIVNNVLLLDTYPPPSSTSKVAKARRWLQGWWSLPRGQRFEALLSRLSWLGQAGRLPAGELSALEKELLVIKQSHIEAFARHRIQPYSGRVSLFFSQDRPISVRSAIHHDWSQYLKGDFGITILRGDHYSLLRKENAGALAEHLSDCSLEVKNDVESPLAQNVAARL